MATFENNTVTIEGRKLLMQSLVNGVGIEFTHFAIGDGAAPEIPENQTALVNQLFTVGVSKTQPSNEEKGVSLVRGSFTNDGGKGDFYWRELGLYARSAGTEDEPILFGYTNTGESADYVPNVNIGSKVVIAILLQVVTGSAKVLYVSDPTAAATMQDIDDMLGKVDKKLETVDFTVSEALETVDAKLLEVDQKLEAFTTEHLENVQTQVEALQKSIDDAITRLNEAGTGFVNTAGDTMTGNLTMSNGAKVIGNVQGNVTGNVTGDVTGNVSGDVTGNLTGNVTGNLTGNVTGQWQGWKLFSSIPELDAEVAQNVTEATPINTLCIVMPEKSRLIHYTTQSPTNTTAGIPDWGVLEIVKANSVFASVTFTSTSGKRWHTGYHSSKGWQGWTLSAGSPVGTVEMYAGATAPTGYLLCQGQSVSKTTYAALFAIIGYQYGGSGESFKLPDFRGVFPRGFDAGRGVDAGRTLGSQQTSAAPNISGYYGANRMSLGAPFTSGALYGTLNDGAKYPSASASGSVYAINLDASLSSTVYQNGVKEVRPVNLAINFIIKY